MVGAIILNPFASPFLLLVLMLFKPTSLAAAAAVTQVPLIGLPPATAITWLVFCAIACAAFTAMVCIAIEARLGPRRTGLSAI